MNNVKTIADQLFEYTRMLRRDFHRNPELGFHEVRTAEIVARELRQLDLEVTTGVAETGVVALLEGVRTEPVVLLRFDMDALPIQEDSGAEYASCTPGVMHACGHDGHVAVGLTVARILHEMRDQVKGTVKFVFQPAEEGMGGAERMIAEGVLTRPRVDYTLGMHLWNERPVGWVGVTTGPMMAGADVFTVRLEGKGGHGALPHETVDPVVAAAQIITATQSIVARNISPLDTAVISICRLQAGDTFNVIPQWAEFSGTFRTYEPSVRQKVVQRFETLVGHIATAMNCRAEVKISRLTPAVNNHPQVADALRQTLQNLPGIRVENGFRTMVSEDFAYMMEQVAGCYLMVGSANAEKHLDYGHHHPKFDFDENALPIAASVMAASALRLLS